MVIRMIFNLLLATVLIVGGVLAHLAWDLSFLFSEWKGYVIIVFYTLMTLGLVLSGVELFGKVSKAYNGIPALIIAEDRFVIYGRKGMPVEIRFDDCRHLRIKHELYLRQTIVLYVCVIRYIDPAAPDSTIRVEIDLSELNCHQHEVEKAIWKAYNGYTRSASS